MRGYLIFTLALSVNALAGEPVCFANGEAYMVATYGRDYRDDQNLTIRQERYGKESYYVARDMTSGTNHQITLLMKNQKKGLCKVLTTYPVAALVPITSDKNGRPISFVAKDQGTISHEILYTWREGTEEFRALRCTESHWIGKRLQSEKISCDSLFEK
jgi:hypothetical protein